ncbi:TPA: hypothetical protein EYO12_02270 [Candidatus Saccharibacteria bacterium]|nr:hypothetical protein [Candidatus Saccharibacteria bacterium]HIO87671.1 hypothetical protein [Candidatus Saccharibacteria bacterium]
MDTSDCMGDCIDCPFAEPTDAVIDQILVELDVLEADIKSLESLSASLAPAAIASPTWAWYIVDLNRSIQNSVNRYDELVGLLHYYMNVMLVGEISVVVVLEPVDETTEAVAPNNNPTGQAETSPIDFDKYVAESIENSWSFIPS